MQLQVNITNGHYRGETINGTFPVVKVWQQGTRGGFITVRNTAHKVGHPEVQRISVSRDNCVMMDLEGNVVADSEIKIESNNSSVAMVGDSSDYEQLYMSSESDDDAIARIKHTFAVMDRAVAGCARGDMRGLVVSGPPGVGKSTGVVIQLEQTKQARELIGQSMTYEIVSGNVSAIGLYKLLYNNSSPNQVLVFDDCDGIFFDEGCLGILKRALDRDNRRISWLLESRVLQDEGIDNSFDFNGTIIVLSNIDFERTIQRGSRLADHLEAIMSRCHYFDIEMSSQRDRVLRVKQMITEGGLFNEFDITEFGKHEVLDFIVSNQYYLREISLRMAKKVADLYIADPVGWVELAEMTVLKRDAKFKRLLEKKEPAESAEPVPVD